jgi:hypothetical protein
MRRTKRRETITGRNSSPATIISTLHDQAVLASGGWNSMAEELLLAALNDEPSPENQNLPAQHASDDDNLGSLKSLFAGSITSPPEEPVEITQISVLIVANPPKLQAPLNENATVGQALNISPANVEQQIPDTASPASQCDAQPSPSSSLIS